jgi:hypothetical protein
MRNLTDLIKFNQKPGSPRVPDLIENFLASFKSHVFGPRVKPIPGSIVKCDLALGKADPTGVYCGENTIIELRGDGAIIELTPDQFICGSNGSLVCTPFHNVRVLNFRLNISFW